MLVLTRTNCAFGPHSQQSKINQHPEIQLIALLVMVVKLFNPFDDRERYASSSADSSELTVDWSVWEAARDRFRAEAGRPFQPGTEAQVSERDVLDLSDQQLDAYMDWYDEIWVEKQSFLEKKKRVPDELLDMFPVGRGVLHPKEPEENVKEEKDIADKARNERLKTVQERLKTRPAIPDGLGAELRDHILRVGDAYQVYDSEDQLSGTAKTFFAEVSEMAGMSLATLVDAVYLTEQRVLRTKHTIIAHSLDDDDVEIHIAEKSDHRTRQGKQRQTQVHQ